MSEIDVVGVLDLGFGNIKSVANAVRILGADPCLIKSPDELENVDRFILPGVGSFHTASETLFKDNWVDNLNHEVHEKNKPLLGICLGMQLLFEVGLENGESPGLGLVEGKVSRLERQKNLRIPHVGWNEVEWVRESRLMEGIDNLSDFYFVHSFAHQETEDKAVVGLTEYGAKFTSIVEKGHIFGVQFHPEKSQSSGLKLLSNFIKC